MYVLTSLSNIRLGWAGTKGSSLSLTTKRIKRFIPTASEGAEPGVRVYLHPGGRAALRDQVVPGQLRDLPVRPQRAAPHQNLLPGGLQYQRKHGSLTKGEGSVQLTSSSSELDCRKINNMFSIKSNCSKLVSTRRSTVLSISLE